MKLIEDAVKKGQKNLSEYEAKKLLAAYNIPVTREELVRSKGVALQVARVIGYPVVLKFCSYKVTHKTEMGLIETNLRNDEDLIRAFDNMQVKLERKFDDREYLVQEMVKGSRELVAGMIRDAEFGPCIMFGLGGIFTEILKDVTFRVAPINKADVLEMTKELRARNILGSVRGMEAVDLDVLTSCLEGLGRLGLEQYAVKDVDINPLIIRGNQLVAVDALVTLHERT